MRKIFKNTNGGFSLQIIITIIIILAIALLIYWSTSMEVECGPGEKTCLSGYLRGFHRNETYWNVMLDDDIFLFSHFDVSYMKNLIGHNVTIVACHRTKVVFELPHYDLVYAYIQEGGEGIE